MKEHAGGGAMNQENNLGGSQVPMLHSIWEIVMLQEQVTKVGLFVGTQRVLIRDINVVIKQMQVGTMRRSFSRGINTNMMTLSSNNAIKNNYFSDNYF